MQCWPPGASCCFVSAPICTSSCGRKGCHLPAGACSTQWEGKRFLPHLAPSTCPRIVSSGVAGKKTNVVPKGCNTSLGGCRLGGLGSQCPWGGKVWRTGAGKGLPGAALALGTNNSNLWVVSSSGLPAGWGRGCHHSSPPGLGHGDLVCVWG